MLKSDLFDRSSGSERVVLRLVNFVHPKMSPSKRKLSNCDRTRWHDRKVTGRSCLSKRGYLKFVSDKSFAKRHWASEVRISEQGKGRA